MSERIEVLTRALALIEQRLAEEVHPQEIADACHYSLSGLQRIFTHVFRMGLAEYMNKRRITLAARDLLRTGDTVLEIAMRYGFQSHEVFTRSFKRVWGVSPSRFRRERRFADIYPMHVLLEGGKTMSARKGFDPTALYDAIRAMNGTYALILDTVRLMEINNRYGNAAGDLVIAECLKRIDERCGEGMCMFRIGGDEYALLTGCREPVDAERIAHEILQHNGKPIVHDGIEIPVLLRYQLYRLDETASVETMIETARNSR